MTASCRDRETFLAQLVREFPDQSVSFLLDVGRKILRQAATLQRVAEAACNHELRDWERDSDERAEAALRRSIAELPGLSIASIGGDPRGYVVKLKLPSGRGNTWGGDETGWGVPA